MGMGLVQVIWNNGKTKKRLVFPLKVDGEGSVRRGKSKEGEESRPLGTRLRLRLITDFDGEIRLFSL